MLHLVLLIAICQGQVLEWEQNLYKKVFQSYTNVIQVYASKELLASQEYQVCAEELYTGITYKHDMLYNMIKYSGKGMLEVGSEEECLNSKMAYFLLVIIKYQELYYTTDSASDIFINNLNYFSGFCVMKDCVGFVENLFSAEHNPFFYDFLTEMADIYSVELIKAEETVTSNKASDVRRRKLFIWVIIGLFVYLCFKVIIFFIGVTMDNSGSSSLFSDIDYEYDEDEATVVGVKGNPKSKEEVFKKMTNQSLNERIKTKSTSLLTNDSKKEKEIKLSRVKLTKSIEGEDENSKSINNPLFNIIYVIFSFGSGINILATATNFVYNGTGLDMFNFFRVWALFWMTYQHNLWALIRIPTRDLANVSFFKSFYFSIVKYSIYAPDMYIIIDGLMLGYKLMAYTKHFLSENNTKALSIKALLSFYVNILPRAALLIFVFFLFHYFTDDYSLLFNLGTMFKYFTKNFIYCRACMKNPMELLTNPLRFLYLDIASQERGFTNCFKFIHIFMNEFICFTFILIAFYFSLKFKSKKYDYALLIVFILNISLSFLSINSFRNGDYYSLIIFLGESSSLKYPHLFFNTYFIGFLMGISIFYYRDMISKNPFGSKNNYRPFSFCHKLIIKVDRLTKRSKLALILSLIAFQSLLSCSFYFMCHVVPTLAGDGLNFTYMPWLGLFDKYEKTVFMFAFAGMIILIAVYPNDTLFKQVYAYNIFAPFSRVGFSYFCSMDTLIYMFYSLCKIELHLSYLNVLLMTIGLVFLLSFVNGIIVMMVELPLRIIIKLIKRRSMDTQAISRCSNIYHA